LRRSHEASHLPDITDAAGGHEVIISASRRTDIPAFFSEWFMKRIEEGVVCVADPFNPRQVGRFSLLPDDVDAIVFWSKNPRPLMARLNELDSRGTGTTSSSP
jgi:hypothetical protein